MKPLPLTSRLHPSEAAAPEPKLRFSRAGAVDADNPELLRRIRAQLVIAVASIHGHMSALVVAARQPAPGHGQRSHRLPMIANTRQDPQGYG